MIDDPATFTWPHGSVVLMLGAHAVELFLKGALLKRDPGLDVWNHGHNIETLKDEYRSHFPESVFEWDIPFASELNTEDFIAKLIEFYADTYQHRGFTKDSLKAEWKHLFGEYRDFSATHVLTLFEVVVDADKVPLTAQVTCTGSLWAISNDSNRRVNLDSWYNEVHYLTYAEGAWRIQGHAWEVSNPPDAPTARPPHPFF